MHPTFGNYRTEQLIRSAPQSNVYQVSDDKGKRLFLKTASIENIVNEVRMIEKADSPHVVKLTDYDLESEQPYLVTEHAGLQLSLLKLPRPHTEVEKIMKGLFIALEDIHRKGIVHGDLKPGNVLFDEKVTLCDLAGSHDSQVDNTLTNTGSLTFGYIPPEVEKGQQPTTKSDMYQAGIILYELCSGHQLRPHSPPMDSLDVPSQAKTLFKELIAANPKERPNAQQALKKLKQSIPEPAPKPNIYEESFLSTYEENQQLQKTIKRHEKRWKIATVAGCLAVAVGVIFYTGPVIKKHIFEPAQAEEPARISYWFQQSNDHITFPMNLDASGGSPKTIPITPGIAPTIEQLIERAEVNDKQAQSPILLDNSRNIRRQTYTPRQIERVLYQLQDENGVITSERVNRALRAVRTTNQGYDEIIAAITSTD